MTHDDQPDRYAENEATHFDDSHRRDAKRVKREAVKHKSRTPPPEPSPKLGNTYDDIRLLFDELRFRATQYAARAQQAFEAESDRVRCDYQGVSFSDNLDYGVMETLCREVANRIKHSKCPHCGESFL